MSSTAEFIVAEQDDKPYRLLQEFVGDNDLHRLEILLGKFNLFEAMNLMRQEIRHSAFLAYLLNPRQNHGLNDVFLKSLLRKALAGSFDGVSPIHVDIWKLSDAQIHCEWQNIDIFIRDETNRLAVIIENKIDSSEHDNQLDRYLSRVQRDHDGWHIVPIYLTIDGDKPSGGQYLAVGYNDVCEIIESILKLRGKAIDPDVRVLMEHYVEMLRRHFLSESKVAELCQQLYKRHKEALDLIYEHRPDRAKRVSEFLELSIRANEKLAIDHCSKAYIQFIPKELDVPILMQGSGWTKSGRILLFEMENNNQWLNAKLIIGPGLNEIREKLFEIAKNKPFDNPAKLYPQWTTIYKHRILHPNAYTLEDEAFDEKLGEEWKKFLEKDLPPLIAAFNDIAWIHESRASESKPRNP